MLILLVICLLISAGLYACLIFGFRKLVLFYVWDCFAGGGVLFV